MADEAKWYVVHTYSGYESKVAATIQSTVENRKLHDLIFEVKVPTETVTEIKDSKEVKVEHKTYPGYVFVRMIHTDDSWHVIRNVRGVTGFVGPGSAPVPLTDAEVAATLGVGVVDMGTQVSYAVGDSVKIIDGPMAGYIGIVDEISIEKNVVRIEVSMLGRKTPTEVELRQVERI